MVLSCALEDAAAFRGSLTSSVFGALSLNEQAELRPVSWIGTDASLEPKRNHDGSIRLGEDGLPEIEAGYGWVVFVSTVLIFVLAFFGLSYSIYPDIVIGRMTVWQAAIGTDALTVIFIGVAITLPVIIVYTIFMYRVFWGKARDLTYN